MWILIRCNDDNGDCEISTHSSKEEAMIFLREEASRMWEEDNEENVEVLSRKNTWTLDEISGWFLGENDINTIHLKEVL